MVRRFCLSASVLRALLAEWRCRARSRAEIAALQGCTIRDLGLARSQLRFEAEKPFWRK
ncbi:DUF1127 domain-containing protein [Reyranella sp.]|uniref:DUF1127 domain-containing protein n=1 Tax=Reyranella sp. TaxID=1929291 RepID=UPI0037846CDB